MLKSLFNLVLPKNCSSCQYPLSLNAELICTPHVGIKFLQQALISVLKMNVIEPFMEHQALLKLLHFFILTPQDL